MSNLPLLLERNSQLKCTMLARSQIGHHLHQHSLRGFKLEEAGYDGPCILVPLNAAGRQVIEYGVVVSGGIVLQPQAISKIHIPVSITKPDEHCLELIHILLK